MRPVEIPAIDPVKRGIWRQVRYTDDREHLVEESQARQGVVQPAQASGAAANVNGHASELIEVSEQDVAGAQGNQQRGESRGIEGGNQVAEQSS